MSSPLPPDDGTCCGETRDYFGRRKEIKNLKKIIGIPHKKKIPKAVIPLVPPVRERIEKWDPEYVQPCNLKCVTGKQTVTKKKHEVLEFEGISKVTIVDPTPFDSYRANRIASAMSVLSIIMMGMLLFVVLTIVLQYKFYYFINVHIIACAFGLHVMLPTAYMMKEKYAMPALYFQDAGRKCQSVLLRVIGVSWVAISYCILFMDTVYMIYEINTLHSVAGYIALWVALFECFLQFYPEFYGNPKLRKHLKRFQTACKLLCMLFSTLCFAFIITRPSIKASLPHKQIDILLIFMVLYISFVANLGMELRLFGQLHAYIAVLRIKRANRNRPPCAKAIPI